MPSGLTMKPADCILCNLPLDLPRVPKQKLHKQCRNKYQNEKRKEKPDYAEKKRIATRKRWRDPEGRAKLIFAHKRRHKEIRALVITKYGSMCSCCGENHFEFLAIDHINGKGKEHRKQNGNSTQGFYRWLYKNPIQSDLRLLCHNCNLAYGLYGYCPHTKLKMRI